MKNINSLIKNIVISSGMLIGGLLLAGTVVADGNCTPLYGGGVTCPKRGEMIIDKQVKNPLDGNFVDNITEFDTKSYFEPQEEVVFRIFVRNTGGDTIDEIKVTDIWPEFITFVSGPGEYKKDEGRNGTLTFYVNNLASGESREYWVYGKAFDTGNLPEPLICKIQNRGQVRASEDRFNEDTSEFCIERGGKKVIPPIKEIPKTGAGVQIVSFAALSSVLGAGFVLRRKAEKLIK